ncbi:MAG: 1,4-alpha-glucan branching protein GlgB [Lachnospiraceae bacterium]|nr:1,4-alpha-glucan branching protein GlgB [Lachnospiraceae bacterium]
MTEKIYELMDWPGIESIVYSEEDKPNRILGAFKLKKGILIQTFQPQASAVKVKFKDGRKTYDMELVDEAGFYVIYVPGKKKTEYTLILEENGKEREIEDPYRFEQVLSGEDCFKFNSGIHYEVYESLGAHHMEVEGVSGVHFAVWVPKAIRVSVVGEFNQWDGRRHQMNRIDDSDIFELFIPEVTEGDIYKFEIKMRGGLVLLKSDPYAQAFELRPGSCSKVTEKEEYQWQDNSWIEERENTDFHEEPVSIYELHLGSFKRKGKKSFYNYRELAPMVIEQVKELNMTHVELLPVMEHILDESWGYEITGYYAPTSRFGTANDFKYFVDELHKAGIGVILDWVPAHFPKNADGLVNFNGYYLYEPSQENKREHKRWGTYAFDYGKKEVSNFLIANALYWIEQFHADGLRVDAVSAMLYLDYDRLEGDWTPNMYGGNENLEAIEFIKHLNSIMKKRNPNVLMIAEESTLFGNITRDLEEEGLGFDYRWNFEFMNKSFELFGCDPLFRKGIYNEFLNSMTYAYMENYVLPFSHDEVVHGKGSMLNKMAGSEDEKYDNLRLMYAYQMVHPGKKLTFMGNEVAGELEWSESAEPEWKLLKKKKNAGVMKMISVLNEIYQTYPALYELEEVSHGIEWINNTSINETVIVFLRKGTVVGEDLLVICNFTPVLRENYKIGVPYKAKYKEIFNSDDSAFGGNGNVNANVKSAREEECDEREYSLRVKLAPLSISIFKMVADN